MRDLRAVAVHLALQFGQGLLPRLAHLLPHLGQELLVLLAGGLQDLLLLLGGFPKLLGLDLFGAA